MTEDDSGYKRLAQELILGAVAEYHAYHTPQLRRSIVLRRTRGQPRSLRKRQMNRIVPRLKEKASLAERWLRGADARYPFRHAAEWLGWDAGVLGPRLMDTSTGWNLLVQAATTPRTGHLPEGERVAVYFESLK